MNENTQAEDKPVDGYTIEVVELDLANEGPPIFDVEVTAPAIARHVYAVIKKPEVRLAGSPNTGKLMPRIVFEGKVGEPKSKVRIVLLQAGDVIPSKDMSGAQYLGSIVHPMTSMPIAVYSLPFNLADLVDAAKMDIGAPMLEQP